MAGRERGREPLTAAKSRKKNRKRRKEEVKKNE
jgi:hypothetical protein